jgi:hypothetical protein
MFSSPFVAADCQNERQMGMLKTKYLFGLGLVAGTILAAAVSKTRGSRLRKTFVADRSVLPAAIHHVAYEYSNLIHSSNYIVSPDNGGGPVSVHIADVFLLNCRKLGDFFRSGRTDKPDVRAFHFCTEDPMPPPAMPHFHNWKAALDQNLAHISYKRVTDPIVFYDGKNDSARVKALTEEIRAAFRLFLEHIDEKYKPAFSAALNARRGDVGNIPLP